MQIEIIAGSHQASRLLSAFVILDAVDISSGEPHAVKEMLQILQIVDFKMFSAVIPQKCRRFLPFCIYNLGYLET